MQADSQLLPLHSVGQLPLRLLAASDNPPLELQHLHPHLRSARARLGSQPLPLLLRRHLEAAPASLVLVLHHPRLANLPNQQVALALLPPHRKVRKKSLIPISILDDSHVALILPLHRSWGRDCISSLCATSRKGHRWCDSDHPTLPNYQCHAGLS